MKWLIIHIIVATILSTAIFLEQREPKDSLLWTSVLIALPIIGVILFILIGRDNRKHRLIERDVLTSMTSTAQSFDTKSLSNDQQKLASYIRNASSFCVQGNDQVDIFTDFDRMFQALLSDIQSAQRLICIEFFKIEDDDVGNQLADTLIHKANDGVEVRLIYDHVANLFISSNFYRRMKSHGIRVNSFQPFLHSLTKRTINNRNHRKIVSIDGKVSYMGGMNIAQRYRDGIQSGIWRDTFLRIKGNSTVSLQSIFMADWNYCTRTTEPIPNTAYSYQNDSCSYPIQVAMNNPWGDERTVHQALLMLIEQSRQSLFIQSPYFIPDRSILEALKRATLAGVDVRVMLPAKPDKGVLVHWASQSYFTEAMLSGVKIYLYNKGYMHAKTLVCDSTIATVGSTNIDNRSFFLNFEVNCFIYDKALCEHLEATFLKDEECCTCLSLSEWQARSAVQQLRESFARPFAPLL